MNKTRFSGLLLITALLSSCDPAELLSGSDSNIKITDVSLRSIKTKSTDTGSAQIGKIKGSEFTMDIYEEDTLMDNTETKAGEEKTTASLDNFTIHGYLDDDILNMPSSEEYTTKDLHFIKGASVGKAGGTWEFSSGDYKWRSGVIHRFWAYTPSLSDFNIFDDNQRKARFSYDNEDASEDVLVTFKEQYYGREDEDAATRDSKLSLQFHHVLSELNFSSQIDFFKRYTTETGNTVTLPAENGRCNILGMNIRDLYDKGVCELEEDKAEWDSLDYSGDALEIAPTGSPLFVIPQEKSNSVLCLTIEDTYQQMTRPFIFASDVAFGSGSWIPGHKYSYLLQGQIRVNHKVNENQRGFDADFNGKGFKLVSVIEGVQGEYISRIRLSWDGVVKANPGNDTYFMIMVGDHEPSGKDYLSMSSEQLKAEGVGFAVNHKTQELLTDHSTSTVGAYNPNADQSVLNTVHCSCIIDIPVNMNDFSVYVVYNGGQNGLAKWHLSNMKLEVLEWR